MVLDGCMIVKEEAVHSSPHNCLYTQLVFVCFERHTHDKEIFPE